MLYGGYVRMRKGQHPYGVWPRENNTYIKEDRTILRKNALTDVRAKTHKTKRLFFCLLFVSCAKQAIAR